jgi:glucokinase
MTYSIGVDIGGTNIRAAVVKPGERTADIVKERRELVPEDKNPLSIVRLVKKMVDDFGVEYGSIGVGFAGMIDSSGVVRNAPAFGWKDVALQSLFTRTFCRHVGLANDLNAICSGEYNYGAGYGCSNVLCVYVGTGIGAAAILDDYLFEGHSGVSFELGHVKVKEDYRGPTICGCGSENCVESIAGGAALAKIAKGHAWGTHAGDLDSLYDRYLDAEGAIDDAAEALGGAVANMCTLLNPECLIIGGTVWEGCPNLKKVCLEEIKRLTNPPAYEAMVIKDSVLGDNAGILGASALR